MALEVGSRPGNYEVTAPIGEGGMGEVYRARDTKLDLDAADLTRSLAQTNAGGFPRSVSL